MIYLSLSIAIAFLMLGLVIIYFALKYGDKQ